MFSSFLSASQQCIVVQDVAFISGQDGQVDESAWKLGNGKSGLKDRIEQKNPV